MAYNSISTMVHTVTCLLELRIHIASEIEKSSDLPSCNDTA